MLASNKLTCLIILVLIYTHHYPLKAILYKHLSGKLVQVLAELCLDRPGRCNSDAKVLLRFPADGARGRGQAEADSQMLWWLQSIAMVETIT